MMSIDHQKNYFKRSRDEIEEGDNHKDQNTNQVLIKKRKLESSKSNSKSKAHTESSPSISMSKEQIENGYLDQSDSSVEFQQKMYKSYIKSALDALEHNVSTLCFYSFVFAR